MAGVAGTSLLGLQLEPTEAMVVAAEDAEAAAASEAVDTEAAAAAEMAMAPVAAEVAAKAAEDAAARAAALKAEAAWAVRAEAEAEAARQASEAERLAMQIAEAERAEAGRMLVPAPPSAPAPAAEGLTLADVGNITGRVHDEAPESTTGGQTTCIVCMVGPKSHLAVPCGHQLACERCTASMKICPYCRTPVQCWLMARLV